MYSPLFFQEFKAAYIKFIIILNLLPKVFSIGTIGQVNQRQVAGPKSTNDSLKLELRFPLNQFNILSIVLIAEDVRTNILDSALEP